MIRWMLSVCLLVGCAPAVVRSSQCSEFSNRVECKVRDADRDHKWCEDLAVAMLDCHRVVAEGYKQCSILTPRRRLRCL